MRRACGCTLHGMAITLTRDTWPAKELPTRRTGATAPRQGGSSARGRARASFSVAEVGTRSLRLKKRRPPAPHRATRGRRRQGLGGGPSSIPRVSPNASALADRRASQEDRATHRRNEAHDRAAAGNLRGKGRRTRDSKTERLWNRRRHPSTKDRDGGPRARTDGTHLRPHLPRRLHGLRGENGLRLLRDHSLGLETFRDNRRGRAEGRRDARGTLVTQRPGQYPDRGRVRAAEAVRGGVNRPILEGSHGNGARESASPPVTETPGAWSTGAGSQVGYRVADVGRPLPGEALKWASPSRERPRALR